jgi:hypothetical protein
MDQPYPPPTTLEKNSNRKSSKKTKQPKTVIKVTRIPLQEAKLP